MSQLGRILLDLGYVTEDDLQDALAIQRASGGRRRIGEILVEMSVKEEELLEGLSKSMGVPVASEEQFPEAMPVENVSFDFLRENMILPLKLKDGVLEVAIAYLTSSSAMENMRSSFDYRLRPFLASGKLILSHVERLRQSKDAVMQRLLADVTEEETVQEVGDLSALRDLAQEQGIIRLVNLIIENAVKERTSDIHVEPEEMDVRVRYRIDGILYDKEMLPLKTQAALSSRIKLLSQMNIAERRLPQDGRIKGRYGGKDIDIRVSTLPTVYGESIVMRLLDRETSFIGLEELGFDRLLLDKYDNLIKNPYGMLLITGPTGSGKTTTLYASLAKINHPDRKLITIEEPVEYLLKGINQIQVRPKIGLTFASGLRHIVRQDPDVVMVGEIRDLETANISIHAALTGHLLFSTLHTNDAPSALTRLSDMGVENYLIASTLIGIMAQRLVRRICHECKEPVPAPAEMLETLGPDVKTISRGAGCPACMNTGYKGRIAIFELLEINDDVRDLIVDKSSAREIKEKAVSLGMRTLYQDGIEKVKRGITTLEEVLRVTQVQM
ncbi:MAG: ATPase, T2SS/T4P/T4SS family [Nitrospirota bacterium]